jgi:hypothetical protein
VADVYNKDETFSLCASLGVVVVRERLLLGQFHVGQKPHAEAWLSLHESSVKDRAEAREEESLSISRKALSNSERATRIAISAIVLSIIMAIYEIIKWYSVK